MSEQIPNRPRRLTVLPRLTKADVELRVLESVRRRDRKQATTRRRRQGAEIPSALSDILMNVLKESGTGDAVRRYEETRALMAWERFVGESAAKVSKALRIRSQTLIVRVSDPLWMQQLTLIKRDLLIRYREHFPKMRIHDIYFTWGTHVT